MAVLFGLIYLRLDYDQKGVMNINGVIFLILTNMTFGNLFPILNSLPKEIPIFVREQKAGMYRVINYYAAKFLNEVSINSCFENKTLIFLLLLLIAAEIRNSTFYVHHNRLLDV